MAVMPDGLGFDDLKIMFVPQMKITVRLAKRFLRNTDIVARHGAAVRLQLELPPKRTRCHPFSLERGDLSPRNLDSPRNGFAQVPEDTSAPRGGLAVTSRPTRY